MRRMQQETKVFHWKSWNVFKTDTEERIFFTTSERLAGDLSESLLKANSHPSFRKQEPQETIKKDGAIIKGNYQCYRISECYATTATVFNKESVVYRGEVYDLTLERNHIMYIRRNGKCFWGSNCMCYTIPILKTEDEFWDLDEDKPSVNEVRDVPDNFKEWIADNADRIGKAEGQGTFPYFIRDNKEVVDAVLRGESTETAVSNSEKAVSNPENGSIATEKAVSEMETTERERIEANRREYERLLADPDYTDVEFNPKNGGLKAKHKNHNIDKDKGWYELEVQETAYQHGHSVILEEEIHTIQGKKNVEGLFDGLPFEIAGRKPVFLIILETHLNIVPLSQVAKLL